MANLQGNPAEVQACPTTDQNPWETNGTPDCSPSVISVDPRLQGFDSFVDLLRQRLDTPQLLEKSGMLEANTHKGWCYLPRPFFLTWNLMMVARDQVQGLTPPHLSWRAPKSMVRIPLVRLLLNLCPQTSVFC